MVVFGDFEWDADKASSNRSKHRVSFEEAEATSHERRIYEKDT